MLNMDFGQCVVIDTNQQEWVPSPMHGVWRKPLAREEAERGHATSIVRYEPGASFSAHDHPLGEEILVLAGVFSDETGDFPAGTYFRNPPGFRHAPFSREGCVIFVKLHQFQPDDRRRAAVDTTSAHWQEQKSGISVLDLHQHGKEQVLLLRVAAGLRFAEHEHPGGEEVYVRDGAFSDQNGSYAAGTWLRYPPGSHHAAWTETGVTLWIKTGHLGD